MNSGGNARHQQDVDVFLAGLGRFRRRLARLEFVRLLPAAAVAALLVTAVAALAGPRVRIHLLPVLLVGGFVSMAAAAIVAAVRNRSLSDTAALVDRRFHLDDSVLSALVVIDDGDEMSGLVVADAVRRLADCTPQALAVQPPRTLTWLAAIGVIGTLAATLGRAVPARTLPQGGDGVGGMATTGPADGPAPAQRRTDQPGTNIQGAAARPQPSSEARAVTDAASPGAPRHDSQHDVQHDAQDQAHRAETRSTDNSPSGDMRQRPGLPAATRGNDAPTASTHTTPRDGGNGKTRAANATSGNGHGASAGGSTPTGNPGLGAGGVNGGARAAAAQTLRAGGTAASDADYAVRFRAAWDRAESAVARERVPAGRRAYVHDYFVAIRPHEVP
ncbi:MAG: hypothetical protein ABUS56_06710 [Acidobacteriota bacterium]